MGECAFSFLDRRGIRRLLYFASDRHLTESWELIKVFFVVEASELGKIGEFYGRRRGILKKILKRNREVLLYLLFGGLTTGVNWVIYVVSVSVLHMPLTGANTVAWIGAVVFAFFTNKKWVFESRSFQGKTLLREGLSFLTARCFSGVLEIFVPGLLFHLGWDSPLFGIEGFSAKAAVSITVIILNYILSKLLVFRKKGTDHDRTSE